MPKLRNTYTEDREVPALGRVVTPGETCEVPEDLVESFLAAGWTPIKKKDD